MNFKQLEETRRLRADLSKGALSIDMEKSPRSKCLNLDTLANVRGFFVVSGGIPYKA